MKNIFNILMLLLLFNPLSIFSQWQNVSNNFPPDIIHAGYAIDAVQNCALVSIVYSTNTGIYPDTFRVFRTTDIGNSWTEIAPPYYGQNEVANDVSIIDPLHYWLATDEGRILATTNGGLNWSVQFYNTSLTSFMNYIEMFDIHNGIAMGDGLNDVPIFLKTSDGGQNWASVNNSVLGGISGGTWSRVDFTELNTGYFYASGITEENLYKTDICCTNWDTVFFGGNLSILKFFDANRGIFLNSTGSGKRTTDGGTTWDNIPFTFDGMGADIEFVGNTYFNVWVITYHKMYFSSDFGNTWLSYPFNNNIWLYDLEFYDENIGWILTNEGVFYTDNNANITKVDEQKNTIIEYSLIQNYPNPFNPTTKIVFTIPKQEIVILKVYDVLGKEVATLVNEYRQAGKYETEFYATGGNAEELPSGVYFYQLRAGDYTSVKKMILLK